MKNSITSLSFAALQSFASGLYSCVSGSGGQATYGISAVQAVRLDIAKNALAEASSDVESSKAQYHRAVQAREAAARVCAEAAASIARCAYAQPDMTPALLAAAGLEPRKGHGARIVPTPPTELTATYAENGILTLKWNRFDNPGTGVTFLVEAQTGAGAEWQYVQNTGATRLKLSGYAPSAPVSFRVSATTSRETSAPCAPVTLWAESASPALRLAA